MEIEVVKLNTTVTRVTYSPIQGGHKSFMLLSDIHWDNPHCDRVLLKKHLDLAKERQAGVFVFGDLFCAMQGKYDPRGSKTGVRPEHNVANYLDAIVEDCAAFWQPYAENLIMVTPGNHETSILKRVETDIVARFAALVGCHVGTYSGWVLIKSERSPGKAMGATMAYHHGYGGGGPVTKDVIQASRKAVYLPDADVVVSGHTHDRNIFPIQRIHLNKKSGNTWLEEQLHLKLGTYKDEYSAGEGWAVERGMPPKSLGGCYAEIKASKGAGKDDTWSGVAIKEKTRPGTLFLRVAWRVLFGGEGNVYPVSVTTLSCLFLGYFAGNQSFFVGV